MMGIYRIAERAEKLSNNSYTVGASLAATAEVARILHTRSPQATPLRENVIGSVLLDRL